MLYPLSYEGGTGGRGPLSPVERIGRARTRKARRGPIREGIPVGTAAGRLRRFGVRYPR